MLKRLFFYKGDFKYIESDTCLLSIFGTYIACANGYYLNKIQEKCIKIEKIIFVLMMKIVKM